MPKRTLPGLGLEAFFDLGENGWNDEFDENMRKLSFIADGRVLSRTTPLPGTGTAGDVYIVPTGDANGDQIAIWDGPSGSEAWVYYPASEGWAFYVLDEDINVQFDGTAWNEFAGASSGGGGGGGGTTTLNEWQGFRAENTVTASVNGGADIICDNELFDTASAYDPVTGIFTVPASLNGRYMMFSGATRWDTAPAVLSTSIQKDTAGDNSFVSLGGAAGGGGSEASIVVGPILVATGDQIKMVAFTGAATNLADEPRTFFSGMTVDFTGGEVGSGGSSGGSSTIQLPVFSKQRFHASASQAVSGANAGATITMFDTLDGASDDKGITEAAGVYTIPAALDGAWVRPIIQARSDATNTGYHFTYINLPGARAFRVEAGHDRSGHDFTAMGPMIQVATGDTFSFTVRSGDDAFNITAPSNTDQYVEFEIVELVDTAVGGSGGGTVSIETTALPMVNGDFETGDLTGWTQDVGTALIQSPSNLNSSAGIDDSDLGSFMASGGSQALMSFYQDIDISALENVLSFSVSGVLMNDDSSTADKITLRAQLLDSGGLVIASSEVENSVPETRTDRTTTVGIVAGAVTLRIYAIFDRGSSGTVINAHLDNVAVSYTVLSGSGSVTTTNQRARTILQQSASQSMAAATTQLAFGASDAVVDVGDFWDSASTNIFTVPAGVDTVLFQVSTQVDADGGARDMEFFLRKNGTGVRYGRISPANWGGTTISAIIDVAEGDTLDFAVWSNLTWDTRANRTTMAIIDMTLPDTVGGGGNGGGATNLADLLDVDDTGASEGDVLTRQNDGSYALEAPAAGGGGSGSSENWAVPWRGATVTMAAQDLDLNTGTILSWDSQVNDTDNFWDGAAPTVFTIPAGVTKVRLKARLDLGTGALNSANPYMEFRKNGTTAFVGNGTVAHGQGYNNQVTSLISGVIDVTAGDTLDVNAQFGDSVVPVLNPGTYFQIEVVEATDRAALSKLHPFFIPGLPAAGATVYQTVFTETTILKTTTPTELYAETAATASSVFTIARNGVSVGTITVGAAGQTGTVSVGADVTFNAGDRLSVIAPGSQDATLADVAITLALQLTS